MNAQPMGRCLAVMMAAGAAALVVACGGGESPTGHEQLAQQADALRAQALAVAATSPCQEDAQCGGLRFGFARHTCEQHDEAAYSLISSTAPGAEALAAEQRNTARRAITLAPAPDFACAAYVEPPPTYACVANRCVQRPGSWSEATVLPVQP